MIKTWQLVLYCRTLSQYVALEVCAICNSS